MSLRIVGGVYKNRAIRMLSNMMIRPTLVRARVMIFDTLGSMENKRFLDVFAGSGAMGIEALSRGAKHVIFFDTHTQIINKLYSNLDAMEKLTGKYSIVKTNALQPPLGTPVDVVFIDPPYAKHYIISDVVKKLIKYQWINDQTIIILEISDKSYLKLSNDFFGVEDNKFQLFKTNTISNSKFMFYKQLAIIETN
jgi:16S rRNA (guanine966-N2)-methyltransferase